MYVKSLYSKCFPLFLLQITVFSFEDYTIPRASSFVNQMKLVNKKIAIYVDSQAALMAIKSNIIESLFLNFPKIGRHILLYAVAV